MNPKPSLYLKIVVWFFMSLLLLVVVLAGIFHLDFRLRPESPLIGRLDSQGRALGNVILRELYDSPYYEWGTILERFEKAYGVDFILCQKDGQILAGQEQKIPGKVIEGLRQAEKDLRVLKTAPPPPPRPDGGAPFGFVSRNRSPFRLLPLPPPERLRFRYLLRTTDPTRYWAYVAFPFQEQPGKRPVAMFLLASSRSMTGNGLFFDPIPWIALACFVLVASILLWIPLVRSITRPVVRMTEVAEEIARGNFHVRVDEKGKDEIGRLGAAINHMSVQLENHIMGQKRFLGDIAHELASPVARMDLGLSILEQRLNDEEQSHIEDITEEVRHMSGLINELLSFSRAEISAEKLDPVKIRLAPLVQTVVAREWKEDVDIRSDIDEGISLWAVEKLLQRALSNVLRNAMRYAGDEGPVEVTARIEDQTAFVTVRDWGGGVPESTISRLFEPFYRPQAVRDRKSGGVGLGLAIVKTCIQACGGTVYAENLRPRGFTVTMELRAKER